MSDESAREARFRAIYLAYYDEIWCYAMRRLPAKDAEGVVSDVFLVAWRRLDIVPPSNDVRLWLYTVARNCVANFHRGQARHRRLIDRLTSSRPGTLAVDDPQDGTGDAVEVRAALAQLPAHDQEVLRLLFWEQLDQAEAADVLGITTNAVAVRAHRARQHLSRKLREQRKISWHSGHEGAMLEVRNDE